MGVRSLVLDTDPFSPKVDDKEVHLVLRWTMQKSCFRHWSDWSIRRTMKKPLILVYFILTSPKRGYLVLLICFQTGYVLHMVVHAYHSNIIQDFVCVYLRSMTQYVRSDCGMADGKEEPTIMFEDEAYSAQDLHHPRITENWTVKSKSGRVMCVVLFFFHHGFVPIGFSW